MSYFERYPKAANTQSRSTEDHPARAAVRGGPRKLRVRLGRKARAHEEGAGGRQEDARRTDAPALRQVSMLVKPLRRGTPR